MKLRIIIALILTLVLASVSRRLSERKPELKIIENEGIRIEHTTVVEKIGERDVDISAEISTPKPVENYRINLVYRVGKDDPVFVPMQQQVGDSNALSAVIPWQPMRTKVYYYISVRDSEKNELTLPDRVNRLNSPFMIKFKGKVTPAVLIAHIIAMFAGIFFVFMVLFYDVDLLRGKDALRDVCNLSLLATFFIFLGGMPLGWWVTYQTLGVLWEGIPIGWDITDSKTLIIFLYWIILLYLMKGTIFKKNSKLNPVGEKPLAVLVLMGVILTFLLYLIPHSIQL
jgi:hypothetical protein